ncbi:hypothetical protein [Hymenobacter ruricola]|uniref:Uncharacterized protein n=1 Tax=Hymenobacter ruricola TaxID=2791023 RepID=A0ABS0I161_9BACT|nr:hypothetical protein [Hymenobacter ruricola]MBF9220674.1 hypothetical protein [Hymenobacter ruricola]
MKNLFLLAFGLLLSQTAFCQDIVFKKDIVSVDGKDCLKVNDRDPNNVSFMDLEGNEIFFLKFIHNSKYGPLYTKTTFLNQKLTMTAMSYGFTKKLLLKKLLMDGTLTNCALVPARVENFVLKYDEKVEDK